MSEEEFRPWPEDPRFKVGDRGTVIGIRGWVLKPASLPRMGYQFVTTRPRGCGRSRTEYVHTMVCETFHGPRPEGMEVAHGNGDSADNRAENLSWKTPKDNAADRKAYGTYTRGETHDPAKLTEAQVLEIRALAGTLSQGEIGRRYGVSRGCINSIITRRNWKHI